MYRPNLDKMNKKLKSLGSTKYWKMTEGDNKFRVLPPLDGKSEFYFELTQHHGFNDGERHRAYPCLEAMKGKSCPICTLYRKAVEEGEKEVAQKVQPKTIYLINVLVRGEESIKIFSASTTLLKGILAYMVDEDYGPEILDDKMGRDFTITREGQGFQTRYKSLRISPKPKPVGLEDWESKIHVLENEVEYKSFDDLVDAIEDEYANYVEEWGMTFSKSKVKKDEAEEEEDESEEDEAEPDARSGKGKAGKRDKSGKVPKDKDEGDDEDSEPDDEEDSPKAKGGKKPVKVEEDDDEDDIEEFLSEDDDEEVIEEEEKPKKKAGKKK